MGSQKAENWSTLYTRFLYLEGKAGANKVLHGYGQSCGWRQVGRGNQARRHQPDDHEEQKPMLLF